MDRVDVVIVGAGVVGLACARACAQLGLETILVEQNTIIGSGTSSRNSEVIHAGIYYPTDSLKAKLCVSGKHKLYDYLRKKKIDHERCMKLIVATSQEEEARLRGVCDKALENGVQDLEVITRSKAQQLEPELECNAAIISPSTGILDSHSFMVSLLGDFEAAGGAISYQTTVIEVVAGKSILVRTESPEATFDLETRYFINCAGLSANKLARSIQGFPSEHIPELFYAKGNYFSLIGKSPFRHLIYPLPEPGGLGVHFTKDLSGQGRFGPDVQWVKHANYEVDPERGASFYAAIRKYWPLLPDDHLTPDYCGIRPKIVRPNEPAADFKISTPTEHGVEGIINLFGIESPGLTASLAIGDYVAEHVDIA